MNKSHIKKILLTGITLLLVFAAAIAQPPPPPGQHGSENNQEVPIGSGLIILMALGGAYGAGKVYSARKRLTPFQEKLQKSILHIVPILKLQGITRVSLGIQNTDADVEVLIRELTGTHQSPMQPPRQSEKTGIASEKN